LLDHQQRGQQVVWVRDGIEQGAVGEVAVLVLAAEEELA